MSFSVIARLISGWGAFVIVQFLPPGLPVWPLLIAIIAVIVVCAFGVMEQAEHLARRLGDPYGTLVLTISIVTIEVILISAVMLGPGEHATIARDSIMAVSMIILNLVLGAALLVGGLRHKEMTPNHDGVSAYLAMLMALGTVAFALPAVIGVDGSYTTVQAVPVIVLTIGSYVFFLWRQMGAQAADFQEPGVVEEVGNGKPPVTEVIAEHRAELLSRTGLLLLMAIPIVLLSHTMAELLDVGLTRLGAPVALTGIIIAAIVFLPETITTLRASWLGEIQRVSNLTQGALVSSVGLTVPTVLLIGLLTGQTVVFAESPANLMLLAVTALLSASVASGTRVGAVHGVAHLMVFAMYVLSVFV